MDEMAKSKQGFWMFNTLLQIPESHIQFGNRVLTVGESSSQESGCKSRIEKTRHI
jgi:hypothetical protein